MPARTRILLINIHSTHNAGDAALMYAAIAQLEVAFPGATVTLLMNDPASYQGPLPVVGSIFTWVKHAEAGQEHWRLAALMALPLVAAVVWLGRWAAWAGLGLPRAWRATAQAFTAADLVVSCPGGFLFSAGLSLPLVISVFTMALALWAGKPLYLLPQSIGPFRRGWERRLVAWVLAGARLVMVREALSLERAPLPRSPGRVHLLPDMALTFAGAPLPETEAWLRSQHVDLTAGRPYLGVTAINWHAQNPNFPQQAEYEQALAVAARGFITECGGRVVFFPQVCGPSADQDDRVTARRIAALLSDVSASLSLLQHAPSSAVLKTAMGQMDVFLGTRMHSNLFALSGYVPFLAIGYQFKTQGIVRMVGLEQWVMDIEQARGSHVAERLMQLWAERAGVRAHLSATVPALVTQAAQAGQLIAQDFAVRRGRP
jgi:colanic acid/amylovoran biosynthesis protein